MLITPTQWDSEDARGGSSCGQPRRIIRVFHLGGELEHARSHAARYVESTARVVGQPEHICPFVEADRGVRRLSLI